MTRENAESDAPSRRNTSTKLESVDGSGMCWSGRTLRPGATQIQPTEANCEDVEVMPRPIHIADPYIGQYLREAMLPASSEMVSRGILNRWFYFLQGTCEAKCCAHRTSGPIALAKAQRSDAADFIYHLRQNGCGVATTNNNIVKLRAYYEWAIRADMNEQNPNPLNGIKNDVPPERILPQMTEDVCEQLLKACGNRKGEKRDVRLIARDRAIIAVLMGSGMRRSEVAKLDLEDFHIEDPKRPFLVVRDPKNDKDRIAPLTYNAATLIGRYILHRGSAPGPLFMSQRKGGRLTPAGITQLFERTMKRAGISDSYGVHSFRRGWTVAAKEAGMEDTDIMEIAGWENQIQLRRYLGPKKTQLALDAFYAKMGGTPTEDKQKGVQRSRYGKRAA